MAKEAQLVPAFDSSDRAQFVPAFLGFGYRIEYGLASGGSTTVVDVGTVLSYDQLNLDPGTEYRARVQYYVGTEDSAWTDWEIVETSTFKPYWAQNATRIAI
jgi:hypothetical protein